jgi:riboflavin synthase
MFTGIIESTGRVTAIDPTPGGGRITITSSGLPVGELAEGESVAVNGCCLTATRLNPEAGAIGFDLLRETLDVTNLGSLGIGSLVNLERSLRLGDRLSGHMVQGHVDGTGTISALEKHGQDHLLRIRLPENTSRQIIPRGSIAIDGCSLTAAGLSADEVTCYIIPHTWQITRLHSLRVGDTVNLEFDMIGKFVRQSLM